MTKYMQLMQALRDEITAGKYKPGMKLPSENQLTAEYGVSRQTVRQAFSLLQAEGLIERRQGSGTVVAHRPEAKALRGLEVAVITTYIGEYIFPEMLGGIEEVLSAHAINPLLAATHNRIDNERQILQGFLDKSIDGIIVEGTKTALPNPNIRLYQRLQEKGMPMVFVHGFYPELRHIVHVVADDRKGGAEAVGYLAAHGCKAPCGIFKSDDMQGLYRYAGFVEALQAAGLPMDDDKVLWFTTESRETAIDAQLQKLVDGCDSIVCYNDEVALLVMERLEKLGIRVPGQLSLISFDSSRYSELTPVKITSFGGDERQVGRLAAEKLLNIVAGKTESSAVMPWRLDERDSVRKG